jgi:Uncharacterized protein conserved in bacteria (DUF2219)
LRIAFEDAALKDFGTMVMLVASSVLTMLCQGCAAMPLHPVETAAPPTLGMQMAASAHNPAPSSEMLSGIDAVVPAIQVIGSAPTAFMGTPAGTSAAISVTLTEAEAPDFAALPGKTGFSVKAFDWSGNDAVVAMLAAREQQKLIGPGDENRNLAAEFSFAAPREVTGLDFDVGVAPRISVGQAGGLSAQRLGGEVRIGQGLIASPLSADAPKGWYVFAGADGEALVWDAKKSGLSPDMSDVSLRDQVTVGDMQAGISMQRGGGALSFSYIRREVKYDDRNGAMRDTEDFAGISFTIKR